MGQQLITRQTLLGHGIVLALMLVLVGLFRWFVSGQPDHPMGSLPTLAFVALTIVFAVRLARLGLSEDRFGTRTDFPAWKFLLLALLGLALVKGWAYLVEPAVSELVGQTRDTSRFDGIRGDLSATLGLLAFSWLIVFGEELVFRVVLLRFLIQGMGGSRFATATALLIQAVVFGLVHLYQGPSAIIGSTISGLIFGCLVLAGRGSIWAAFLAHGLNNSWSILVLYLSGSE